MSVLVWTLSLPVASVLLALVWVWWRTRPPGPIDTIDSVAEYQKFRSALAAAEERGTVSTRRR